jgi:TetR/AcrR family transcriptional regulator, fatty acid metabolism regulator protein
MASGSRQREQNGAGAADGDDTRRRGAETARTRGGRRRATDAVDKRRRILDAAVCVFARQGFYSCRVSDVADEAGVAYGLVYHYFASKEEILDTLFVERWQLMLDAIEAIDASEASGREKLSAVASFIIDSYRYSPDVMKVIIVEVTRAAHSFGRQHLDQIRTAYDRIARIVEAARRDGQFKPDISPDFVALCFYGAIEQLLSGWIFGSLSATEEEFERAKLLVVETICGGIEAPSGAQSVLLPPQ